MRRRIYHLVIGASVKCLSYVVQDVLLTPWVTMKSVECLLLAKKQIYLMSQFGHASYGLVLSERQI